MLTNLPTIMKKFKYSYRSEKETTVNGVVYAHTLYDAYGMVVDMAEYDSLEAHSIVVKPEIPDNEGDYEPPTFWKAFTVLLTLAILVCWVVFLFFEGIKFLFR
jgi:hypothetical protein